MEVISMQYVLIRLRQSSIPQSEHVLFFCSEDLSQRFAKLYVKFLDEDRNYMLVDMNNSRNVEYCLPLISDSPAYVSVNQNNNLFVLSSDSSTCTHRLVHCSDYFRTHLHKLSLPELRVFKSGTAEQRANLVSKWQVSEIEASRDMPFYDAIAETSLKLLILRNQEREERRRLNREKRSKRKPKAVSGSLHTYSVSFGSSLK